jgi:hypothetical protein
MVDEDALPCIAADVRYTTAVGRGHGHAFVRRQVDPI